MCTVVLIGWDLRNPPHSGSYTRALLVSQDRQHPFMTSSPQAISKAPPPLSDLVLSMPSPLRLHHTIREPLEFQSGFWLVTVECCCIVLPVFSCCDFTCCCALCVDSPQGSTVSLLICRLSAGLYIFFHAKSPDVPMGMKCSTGDPNTSVLPSCMEH